MPVDVFTVPDSGGTIREVRTRPETQQADELREDVTVGMPKSNGALPAPAIPERRGWFNWSRK
jgi:hypothetical protein